MAVGSQDGRVSIWDLAAQNQEADDQVPNELMFLHEGHKQAKDVRWHPEWQDVLLTTGDNGLHFWKPCLKGPQPESPDEDEGILQVMEEEDCL